MENVAKKLPSRMREGLGEGLSNQRQRLGTRPPLTPPVNGRGI